MRSRSATPMPSGSDEESDSNSVKSVNSLKNRGVSKSWISYIKSDPSRERERYAEYNKAKDEFETRVRNLEQSIRRAGKQPKNKENSEVLQFLQAKLAETTLASPPGCSDDREAMRRMALDGALAKKLQERELKKAKEAENRKRAKEISILVAQRAKDKEKDESSSSDSEPVGVLFSSSCFPPCKC